MLRNIHHLWYSFWCLECWKWHFWASRFKNFLAGHAPRPPKKTGPYGPFIVTAAYYSFTIRLLQILLKTLGDVFESKILVYVQPLITRLCPLYVDKHGFIVHNRFITINCWSAVHYDISWQRTSQQRYIVVIYRFALRDIVATKSR